MDLAPHPLVARLSAALSSRYAIGREIGRGGMATVYLAHDHKHDRDVAIKVLREDLAASVGAERFLAEIRTTARLTHPHILPLHDSGDAEGYLYYVMPYVDGETLRERMDRESQLPLDEAITIAKSVADALAYAHAQGVVHRDVKPENIFLHSGHALVADFGIARALSLTDTRMTMTGMALGTPAYMSPEQAAGEVDVDARADQYALASVLYEMLAGEPPFVGPTLESILVQRFTQPPPRVSLKRAGVPRETDSAIRRGMARDPDERFSDVAGFAAGLARAGSATRVPRDHQSIAVLPFANMSGDAGNDYFSDGVSEEIINALSQLDGLHVAARTSAFSYKGKNVDLRRIGDELGVATVLEGSVRKAGNRLRITAQLIDVADGYHLWSERYDRDLVDVFAIQDEIATSIAAKLNVTLRGGADAQLVKPATSDVVAYEAYLEGRALAASRAGGLVPAAAAFERAIAADPNFAAAHASLAHALLISSVWGNVAWKDVHARAAEAVRRALDIDPGLVSAHCVLGVLRFCEFDRDGARDAWLRAREIDPTDADAVHQRAHYDLVYSRGQTDVAIPMVRALTEADPRSGTMRAHLAIMLSFADDYRAAVEEGRRAVELSPDAFYPTWSLILALQGTGGGVAEARSAVARFARHPWAMMGLALASRAEGDAATADALYMELDARGRSTYVQPVVRAICALAAGREADMFRLLNEAIEVHDPMLAFVLPNGPMLDPYRERTEFKELLERVGWA